VYLGKISYGTYLWHWPVILVMTRTFDLSPLSTVALTMLIATALASLSYQLLEQPVRLSAFLDRYRTPVIATGLAISAVSALVLIPVITDSPQPSAAVGEPAGAATGLTPVPTGFDWEALRVALQEKATCLPGPAGSCTLVEGSSGSILLMGDSHAAMMIPGFVALAEQKDLTLTVAVLGGCPWQRDLFATPLQVPGVISGPDCREKKHDTYDRVIPAVDPDVIFVMNLGYEASGQFAGYLNEDGSPGDRSSPAYATWLSQTTTDSIARLEADGRDVVVLEPIPFAADLFDPLDCLSTATWLEECRYVVPARPSVLEREYRRIDESDAHVWSANLDTLVCPFLPICDPIVGGEVVKVDDSHLSPDFARTLAPSLADYLTSNGIL
jgi:SGNH domain (fused to AT3 domains)